MSKVDDIVDPQVIADAVAGDDAQDILTDHSYDGIQEFDNPMPGWWVWLFVGTVVYSALYLLYFESGMPGRSIQDEYDAVKAQAFAAKFEEIGDLSPNRETLVKYMNDPEWVDVGKVTFKTNCISCHGTDGEGGIGPNLTDESWKNVKNIEDIATVISRGAANGAMPAWENRLSHPNFIVLTAAYVASLRGKGSGGGKAAEGSPIPAWPKPSATSEQEPVSDPQDSSETDAAEASDDGTPPQFP